MLTPLLFTFTLLISTAHAGFSDISGSTPYAGSIEELRVQGIVSGYADGTFRPTRTINRAEFTKIIVGTLVSQELMETCPTEDIPFPDVPSDAWFAPYVCVGWKHSLIRGYPDGTFAPSKNINFAEAAKIVAGRGMDNDNWEANRGEAPWYQLYFEKLIELNALPASYRSPSQLITRGEMAEMIVLERLSMEKNNAP
jgi:hypothetical protein